MRHEPVNLLGREFLADPHAAYSRLREEGAVARCRTRTLTDELDAWVVTRHAEARELLADSRLAKDATGLARVLDLRAARPAGSRSRCARNMLFSDPPEHTRLRRLLGRAFTAGPIQRLRPWIETVTDRLLDDVVPGRPCDLVADLAFRLPVQVMGLLFGMPEDHFAPLRRWDRSLTDLGADEHVTERALAQMHGRMAELVERRRREPADDLVTALLGAQDDGERLSHDEVLSTLLLTLNAGYETTASLIANGVLALLDHPDQLRALRREPALVPAAVEEFLRYESPVNLTTSRYTTAPVPVGDVVIPENELVFVSLLSANRDAAHFRDPHGFDIRRTGRRHLSFGHGIHYCLGAPLARMETEIVLSRLLGRFRHWELAVPRAQLRWQPTLQFRSLEKLPVRFG